MSTAWPLHQLNPSLTLLFLLGKNHPFSGLMLTVCWCRMCCRVGGGKGLCTVTCQPSSQGAGAPGSGDPEAGTDHADHTC